MATLFDRVDAFDENTERWEHYIERLGHRGPTQSVWVANCYFLVNVLDLPFASPIAIYR